MGLLVFVWLFMRLWCLPSANRFRVHKIIAKFGATIRLACVCAARAVLRYFAYNWIWQNSSLLTRNNEEPHFSICLFPNPQARFSTCSEVGFFTFSSTPGGCKIKIGSTDAMMRFIRDNTAAACGFGMIYYSWHIFIIRVLLACVSLVDMMFYVMKQSSRSSSTASERRCFHGSDSALPHHFLDILWSFMFASHCCHWVQMQLQ